MNVLISSRFGLFVYLSAYLPVYSALFLSLSLSTIVGPHVCIGVCVCAVFTTHLSVYMLLERSMFHIISLSLL